MPVTLHYHGEVKRSHALNVCNVNPLDAGRRSTDFAQTPYAAGSLLTDGTVYELSRRLTDLVF